jgi:adenine nucleotide transporter 17
MSNTDMIKHIYKEEGIRAFFKGIVPGMILTVNPIISFIIYEAMKVRLVDSNGNLSSFNIVIMSLVSKLVATIVTYPMLSIKTLSQANEKLTNGELTKLIIDLLNEQGILGLYKGICYLNLGLGAKTIQTLINNTLVMLTYEKIQFLVKVILFGVFLKFKKVKKVK